MKFYYFGATLDGVPPSADDLEASGFEGMLFTYNVYHGDYFTKIIRDLKINQKIKYMVALRPHVMSPQYLCMINDSIRRVQDERLQINLISGHVKPNESEFGGILGDITDQSSRHDRSNYLIDYAKELYEMENYRNITVPDYYVSCTNIHTYTAAGKLGQKIILPYSIYKNGYFLNTEILGMTKPGDSLDLTNKRIMISLGPIIRETQEQIDLEFPKNKEMRSYRGEMYLDRERPTTDTEFFTLKGFYDFVKQLESQGINEIILSSSTIQERLRIVDYIKAYR